MNLNDIVPPLELCKMIPAGEFKGSAMVWRVPNSSFPLDDEFYEIHERDKCESWMKDKQIPAPTLEEIMSAMPYCRVYKKTANFYVAVKENERVPSFSGSTAALKLWFTLKGIEG